MRRYQSRILSLARSLTGNAAERDHAEAAAAVTAQPAGEVKAVTAEETAEYVMHAAGVSYNIAEGCAWAWQRRHRLLSACASIFTTRWPT